MWCAVVPLPVQHLMHGDIHLETHIYNGFGASRPHFVSALQAFWPGLEVIAGYPQHAARCYRPLYQVLCKSL